MKKHLATTSGAIVSWIKYEGNVNTGITGTTRFQLKKVSLTGTCFSWCYVSSSKGEEYQVKGFSNAEAPLKGTKTATELLACLLMDEAEEAAKRKPEETHSEVSYDLLIEYAHSKDSRIRTTEVCCDFIAYDSKLEVIPKRSGAYLLRLSSFSAMEAVKDAISRTLVYRLA